MHKKLQNLEADLRSYADKTRARHSLRFFKTGEGEYAEGDKFIGASVPATRAVAKKYNDIPLAQVEKHLQSPIHEERLCALFILVSQYEKGSDRDREKIYNLYLANSKYINNWDLVDSSAPKIIGAYLFENPNCTTVFRNYSFKGTKILNHLSKSENLWERRIAILSTLYYITNNEFNTSLKVARLLLKDGHDLIHKAVGWMLREIGKRDSKVEEEFIKVYYQSMSRTTLRYAIEKFPEKQRLAYINGKI